MKNNSHPKLTGIKIAQTVRQTCIREAKEAFQDALMSGLCNEGAIEAAIGRMQSLDVEEIVAEIQPSKQ